jgi:multidrug efflux pump subunit AcrB
MTVVSITVVHPKPGTSWEDMAKQLKKANEVVKKHGAENVTVMVGMAAGPNTGDVTVLATSPDWASYGKTQDAMMADPEMLALMSDPNSPVAKWDTYVSMTVPDL